jgi:tryptophan halogenase
MEANPNRISKIIVLGGGSAGFLAAVTLKRKLPRLEITVIRSKELGIIGVGEGSTALFPNFLHGYLRILPSDFVIEALPTFKLGTKFIWGPRQAGFNYPFQIQMAGRMVHLPKPNGFYCRGELGPVCLASALMDANTVFEVRPDGKPALTADTAYHIENVNFVKYIERAAERLGVKVEDDLIESAERRADGGVAALMAKSGRRFEADFFVDCSGFKSYLIGEVMGEPMVDYSSSLFCNRAIVGGWERQPNEPIRPYTIAQTMNAGWSWQIEHEHRINRGYVYCPAFISDAEAEAEFRKANPRLGDTRVVHFISGRRRDGWVKNVCAIGNSYGFVEPLEATALSAICRMCMTMTDQLMESDCVNYPTTSLAYNKRFTKTWDAIRWFLAMHYKFNTRVNTPFWEAARNDVNVGDAADFLEYFQQVGPSYKNANELLYGTDVFNHEGYLTLMVGMNVPYEQNYNPSEQEWSLWWQTQNQFRQRASRAMGVKQALEMMRSPGWTYDYSFYPEVS